LEVLNGKVFISDAKDYKEASKISVYSLTGNLEKKHFQQALVVRFL
jgi:hypothetical protein